MRISWYTIASILLASSFFLWVTFVVPNPQPQDTSEEKIQQLIEQVTELQVEIGELHDLLLTEELCPVQ